MIDFILLMIIFLLLFIGSITDIKTREVPDYLSYGSIIVGVFGRVLWSFFDWSWNPLISGLLGFGIFFAIACALYYLGQWGGGDSKVLMAVGVLLGFELKADATLISFFVNLIFVSAVYSIIVVGCIAVYNRKKVLNEIKKMHKNNYAQFTLGLKLGLVVSLLVLFAVFFVFAELKLFILLLMLIAWLFAYLTIVIRAVEVGIMHKRVNPETLTEGDWIVKDVVVDGKRICGPKDLGVSNAQIKELVNLREKGKLKTVLMKTGIPFIPSFLLAYLATLFYGNVLVNFLSFII